MYQSNLFGTKGYFCIRKTFSDQFFDTMIFYYVAYVFFSIIFHHFFLFMTKILQVVLEC